MPARATVSVCAILLVACAHAPAATRPLAPRRPTFASLDRDRDHGLDERELYREFLRSYDAWDLDDDGRLTREELDVGLFEAWDHDDDARIDRAELEAGAASWLSPEERDFALWDVDGDGRIDRDELRAGVVRIGLFERFDRNGDGHVTDLELADTTFAYWDTDASGAIDEDEWRGRLTASRAVASREERASAGRPR